MVPRKRQKQNHKNLIYLIEGSFDMINWVLFAVNEKKKTKSSVRWLCEFLHSNKRGHQILLITILHVIIAYFLFVCTIITANFGKTVLCWSAVQ